MFRLACVQSNPNLIRVPSHRSNTTAILDCRRALARSQSTRAEGVKIKVAFHCTDLAFYALLFAFNVELVAFHTVL